jgi:erythromycin esterase
MFTKTKSLIFTICFILLLTLSFCKVKNESDLTGQEEQELLEELNQWLIPLVSASPLDLTDDDLSFLDQLRDAKIVALGEATHGTREFFQMKHRIFQYLVEYCQHKAIGFEADFAESIYINNYVFTGEGNLRELMKEKMFFWTWKTEEVLELLEWMKEYNTGKSQEDKIHYHGFDSQSTYYQPDLIREYLLRTLPGLWETAATVLEPVRDFTFADYQNMSEETYNNIQVQLESLKNQLMANKNLLIANSSSREYEITKQLLRTFVQAFIVIYNHRHGSSDTGWRTQYMWRDYFMAENALWIADFFGQDTKITLWAHNGHIARDQYFGGGSSVGYHLSEELNNLYQPVGFAFSKGYFTTPGIDPHGNFTGEMLQVIADEPFIYSINHLFRQASYSNFVFHLDSIPSGSQWDQWLSFPRPFLRITSVYNGNPEDDYTTIDIPVFFSWLIYFDITNASILL